MRNKHNVYWRKVREFTRSWTKSLRTVERVVGKGSIAGGTLDEEREEKRQTRRQNERKGERNSREDRICQNIQFGHLNERRRLTDLPDAKAKEREETNARSALSLSSPFFLCPHHQPPDQGREMTFHSPKYSSTSLPSSLPSRPPNQAARPP